MVFDSAVLQGYDYGMNTNETHPHHLEPESAAAVLKILQARFEKNQHRHPELTWTEVQTRLKDKPGKLWSLQAMEASGGEPDAIGKDADTGDILFADCSAETPLGRRNLCYDRAALDARKSAKPAGSALEMAAEMGVTLLNEEEYRRLQSMGEFDLKTSSWILTPADVRTLGGALFGDRRYGWVFFYHNGAESYYSVRGFRGMLRV